MSRIYSINLFSARVMVALFLIVTLSSVATTAVLAVASSDNTDLSQVINAGAWEVEFKDASRATVASPVVNFTAETFSFDCKTGGTAADGTLGTNTERLYIVNPEAALDGWTLAIAATATTDVWDKGDANDYDFNDRDASNQGCLDDAVNTNDADSFAGLLNVDGSVATRNDDSASADGTGWTLGSATNFDEGTTDSITIASTDATSNEIARWYLTGIDLDQDIPAEQEPGTYTITMTITGTTL